MIQAPTCHCGTCRKCRHRADVQRWRDANRERSREIQRSYYQRHKHAWSKGTPEKVRAQKLVYTETRSGRLTKGPCEVGSDCAGPIHAHHDDYAQPLKVRWLCARHHSFLHREVTG